MCCVLGSVRTVRSDASFVFDSSGIYAEILTCVLFYLAFIWSSWIALDILLKRQDYFSRGQLEFNHCPEVFFIGVSDHNISNLT